MCSMCAANSSKASGVESLKHDLCHALAVGLGVQGSFRQQHGVLLGRDPQLVVEGMVPNLLLGIRW